MLGMTSSGSKQAEITPVHSIANSLLTRESHTAGALDVVVEDPLVAIPLQQGDGLRGGEVFELHHDSGPALEDCRITAHSMS